MTTASGLTSLSNCATSAKGRPPNWAAYDSARLISASQTATNSDSGNECKAAAWIFPTLPQPISAVRTGFISILREILRAHAAQKSQRLGHFLHAVHAIFNAHPALIIVLGQNPED